MRAIPTDDRGVVLRCPNCGQKNRIAYRNLGTHSKCASCGSRLPAAAAPLEIASGGRFDRLVGESPLPVLVDFWAAWCGPCLMVAPELEKLAEAQAGRLVVAKVNTDDVPELGQRFQIRSIPTLSLLVEGREVGRDLGARPAEGIAAFIRQTLKRR